MLNEQDVLVCPIYYPYLWQCKYSVTYKQRSCQAIRFDVREDKSLKHRKHSVTIMVVKLEHKSSDSMNPTLSQPSLSHMIDEASDGADNDYVTNSLSYEHELASQMGPDNYEAVVVALSKVTEEKLSDIAVKMDKNVGGAFQRDRQRENFEMGKDAVRKILCHWYSEVLWEEEEDKVTQMLIDILKLRDIKQFYLAHTLEHRLKMKVGKKSCYEAVWSKQTDGAFVSPAFSWDKATSPISRLTSFFRDSVMVVDRHPKASAAIHLCTIILTLLLVTVLIAAITSPSYRPKFEASIALQVGGCRNEPSKEVKELYRPGSSTCMKPQTIATSLPVPLRAHVAIELKDRDILVCGGTSHNVQSTPGRSCWVFRVKTGEWEVFSPLNLARINAYIMRIGNKIHIIGGTSSDPLRPCLDTEEVLDLDGTMDWQLEEAAQSLCSMVDEEIIEIACK